MEFQHELIIPDEGMHLSSSIRRGRRKLCKRKALAYISGIFAVLEGSFCSF